MSDGVKTSNRWERAKEPQLKAYCDLLARGTAHLVNSPTLVDEVIRIANDADKLLPGRAAPSVLKGRALLKLGKPEQALEALKEAKTRDERAIDDPTALLAWARANARTAHMLEAAQAFRAVLPRTSTLPVSERSLAAFEAGMTVMAQGPNDVDDAVAMLRQARRGAEDSMQFATVVALALALDRSGQREEARAMLADRVRGNPKAALADARVVEALTDSGVRGEIAALVATALESEEPATARESWRKYLEGDGAKGPWAEHARARDAALASAKDRTERHK